jgi:TRAP-type C4-dicarboxylate transport system permease small subunit
MDSATISTAPHAAAAAPLLPPSPPAPAPIRWLARAVDWAIVLIGAIMATLVFANVVTHNVFHADVVFTTELGELLMVWVTFLGAASATRRGAHMVVAELIDRLSPKNRRYADAAIQLVVLLTLGLLVWYGVGITEAGFMSQLTVLEWPMATQYSALPVASSITMVFVLWDLRCIARGDSREQRYGRGVEGAPE